MIATPATRPPVVAQEARRQLAEAIRVESPGMLPAEAQTAARVLYATGYRVNDYGKMVDTR